MDNWEKYNGAILWRGDNPPSMETVQRELRASHALFARWTENYDCGYPTEWWYCLQDKFIPLSEFTAKQRYRIKKGLQNNRIVHFQTDELSKYGAQIARIAIDGFAEYPRKYRPTIHAESFIKNLASYKNSDFWICYDNETQAPCGYGFCTVMGRKVNLRHIKVPSIWLKNEVNAALAYTITEYYLSDNKADVIIDGERNIRHETQYQDFLVRVLQFRLAYCTLRVIYHPLIKFIIFILYPFRHVLQRVKNVPLLYNIYCILNQEQICRTFNRQE